jgi:hypothetical protein
VPQPESVTLDVECAGAGSEGATPYEVLLDAARGAAVRRAVREGNVGSRLGGQPARHPRRRARTVGGVMIAVDGARTVPETQPQSAAAPSPFPPIASYGFCRTVTRGRWSRRTAGSAGCARRASTRRACSARSSTERREHPAGASRQLERRVGVEDGQCSRCSSGPGSTPGRLEHEGACRIPATAVQAHRRMVPGESPTTPPHAGGTP